MSVVDVSDFGEGEAVSAPTVCPFIRNGRFNCVCSSFVFDLGGLGWLWCVVQLALNCVCVWCLGGAASAVASGLNL